MGAVYLSKEAKIAYGIFFKLREKLPKADISTLRHISVYLALTNESLDIDNDLKLIVSTDRTMCNLLLSDGTEIRFQNSSDKALNFVIDKRNLGVCMTLFVSTAKPDDLSTIMICGEVLSGDWRYSIGFDDFENKICFIKIYYRNKLIETGTSYFNPSVNRNIGLDCIDGLGYLSDIMVKLDLLYNNVRHVKKNKLVRRKCV